MTAPHKATPEQWALIRQQAKAGGFVYPSVLLEVVDHFAALKADSDFEQRLAALEAAANSQPAPNDSQIGSSTPDHFRGATEMVATDAELPQPEPTIWMAINAIADRLAALEAAATPPPAPDHSRGAPEMVATDEELEEYWIRMRDGGSLFIDALRSVYNLGRQHAAQPRQEQEPTPQPTPPPAPAIGLVESVIEEICHITGNHPEDYVASGVICAVADWLQQRSDTIANGSQWAEVLRGEIDSGHDVCSCQAPAASVVLPSANGTQWAEMMREEADR